MLYHDGLSSSINPFTLDFLKWTPPSLNLDTSGLNENSKTKSLRAVSSGSAVFVKVSVLVYSDERVNNAIHVLSKHY